MMAPRGGFSPAPSSWNDERYSQRTAGRGGEKGGGVPGGLLAPPRERGQVGGGGVVRRRLDQADRPPLGDPLDVRRDVRPVGAAVARDVHQPVVAADPDESLLPG